MVGGRRRLEQHRGKEAKVDQSQHDHILNQLRPLTEFVVISFRFHFIFFSALATAALFRQASCLLRWRGACLVDSWPPVPTCLRLSMATSTCVSTTLDAGWCLAWQEPRSCCWTMGLPTWSVTQASTQSPFTPHHARLGVPNQQHHDLQTHRNVCGG